MGDEDREGPVEVFSLATEILAVQGATAVVRAETRYGDRARQVPDLWIMHIRNDGRCTWFGEWPYWPWRSYSARHEPFVNSRYDVALFCRPGRTQE